MGDDSLSKKLWKTFLGKLLFIVLAITVCFLIADPLGLVPDWVYELCDFFQANFTTIVFFACFVMCFYLANKLIRGRRREA